MSARRRGTLGQLLSVVGAVGVALSARSARGEAIASGDRENGAALFRVQCAACHGADARGGGRLAPQLPVSIGNLRDPALLAIRSDDDLRAVILKGKAPAMPGAPWLTSLELADLLTFLRDGQLKVADFFPHAKLFTAKSYPLDRAAQGRVQGLVGHPLGANEASVTIVSIYGGDGSSTGPQVVPQDPVQLDRLEAADGKGYLIFADLPSGKGHAVTGIAIARDGRIERVASAAGLRTPAVDRPYQGFVGKGKKGTLALPKPKGKGAPSPTEERAFAAAYARAMEGIAVAEREEKDRHWADTGK